MPNYDIRRFADVDALKGMHPRHLLALLMPHQQYFVQRNLYLPDIGQDIDYVALSGVLTSPDEETPPELGDALYAINEMATLDAMDELLEAAASAGLQLEAGPEVSPADLAVQVYFADRALFEKKHAEQLVRRPRSFQSFQSREVRGRALAPAPQTLAALASELDDWFEAKKRGRGCRVFAFPKEDGVWFLVRHGQPFKREGSLKKEGESSSVYYRPEKHDVLAYNPITGELRINAETKGERDIYRTKLGLHLFGDEHHFPGTAKYTLEPLRDEGAASLICSDVEGMEWVRLTEIRYFWGGTQNELEIRKAADIFAALAAREMSVHNRVPIVGATFSVKFAEAKSPRSVSLHPSNVAKFTRDNDGAVVEEWLSRRGFILAGQAEADEDAEPVLVGA